MAEEDKEDDLESLLRGDTPSKHIDGYPKYTFDRDHSVRIRIFDFNQEIGFVGNEDDPHSADEYYADWLENAYSDFENIGADNLTKPNNQYTLKHIEPHPKNKDRLIHYYEEDRRLAFLKDLLTDIGKVIVWLIIVAVGAYILSIIPWSTIFGFILVIIQEMRS